MKLTLFLILSSACMAQELLRPTVDVNGGNTFSLGCAGQNSNSTALPLGYDSAGPTTSSGLVAIGVSHTQIFKTRIFKTWTTTGNKYTTLTLNVTSSSDGFLNNDNGGTGLAAAAYSTDGGVTWTRIIIDAGAGWPKKTNTVTLSNTQDLTKLQVGVCVAGSGSFNQHNEQGQGPGIDNIIVYDVTTLGNVNGQPGGSGSSVGTAHRGVVIVN